MANIGELSVKLRADLKNFTAGMKLAAKQAETFAKRTARSMRRAGTAIKDFAVRAGRNLTQFARRWARRAMIAFGALTVAAVKWAADAEESENLVRESFEGMTDAVIEWSERLQKQLGLNAVQLRKQAGFFNLLAQSMGLTAEQSFKLSTELTELSADMASFRNQRFEEIFSAMKSGIVGMSRPLQNLGINVKENALEMLLLREGIDANISSLTEAQKVLGRYITILEATNKDTGDLDRTYNSFTNVIRVLITQAKILARELGGPLKDAILPLAITMRDWLINNREDVVEWFTDVVAKFQGFIDFLKADFQQGFSGSLESLTLIAQAVGEAIVAIFKEHFTDIGLKMLKWILVGAKRNFNRLVALMEKAGESLGDAFAKWVIGDPSMINQVFGEAEQGAEGVSAILARLKNQLDEIRVATLAAGQAGKKTAEELEAEANARHQAFLKRQKERERKTKESIATALTDFRIMVEAQQAAAEAVNESWSNVGETIKLVMLDAADSVKSAFVDMLETMAVEMDNFGDAAKQFLVSIAQEIARMQARIVAARILGSTETGGAGIGAFISAGIKALAGGAGKETAAADTGGRTFAGLARGGVVKPVFAANGFAPRGTDRVPAMLSPGEGVLSRGLTDAIRDQLAIPGAGLGGAPQMTIQVQTIDAQSTAQWLNNNKRLITGMMNEALRGNHPTRRFIGQIG